VQVLLGRLTPAALQQVPVAVLAQEQQLGGAARALALVEIHFTMQST